MYAVEEELFMLIPGLLSGIPSRLLGIATYILTAVAIYTISCRRGLRKPWLAWIPVFNIWLLGSLSDQYSYVVRGENKSKRKWLLLLGGLKFALWFSVIVLGISVVGSAFIHGYHGSYNILSKLFGPVKAILGLLLPLLAVTIACYVIRYMALYDVYKSLDPDNCVLFLVLSILFRPTEAFFLFFNRNKDQGMPPRKQEPVYTQEPQWQPPQPEPDLWEQETKDYL